MAGAGRMYEVRARTSFTSALALARVFASGSDGSNLLRSQLVMLKRNIVYLFASSSTYYVVPRDHAVWALPPGGPSC